MPLLQNPLEQPEDKIDIQTALMRLIYHDNGILAEPWVELELLQENPVGHNLYLGFRRGMIFKPHLVAHRIAERNLQLMCNKFADGKRCNPPRLGNADHTGLRIARLMQNNRQLGCFSRSGRAFDNNNLMPFQTL